MTDGSLSLRRVNLRRARLRGLLARYRRLLALSPPTAWAIAALIGALLLRHFWLDEGNFANILFTAAATLAIICVFTLLSRRVLFAAALCGALVLLIVVTAAAKRAVMNMVVHAYDAVFYLGSWSTLSYLLSDQRRYVVAFAAALVAIGLVAWHAYHADGTRVHRRWSAGMLLVSVALTWCGAYAKGERRHMQFYYANLYVSSFYASWGETIEALLRGALLESARHVDGPPLAVPTACSPPARPPHIILIHEESVVQPSLFPALHYDHAVDPFFRSYDDRLYRLRVETYGGASWLTEFSLLAGVSTQSFGGMRQFVQTFTQNKLKDTLPQVLGRCGYRNVVFYPLMKNFVSNDRFYTSIGLNEIFDMAAQGAHSTQERDRFYFTNAMREMERHFHSSRAPLFTFIQTMSAHWPYDYTYMPEVDVPGGDPGTNPEMSEYLRRLAMAKVDYEFLVSELQRRFPRERFLIVHYGDHQPMATRTLLGFRSETDAEDVALGPDSIGFITYYAIKGINYRVPPPPQFETLDVAYLGTLILELAGMPLSDSHRERKRLMLLCKGRYYDCPRREEILAFHRRLIDSGVMAAR
jgi:phosphoglycerol transferase MdoB-like AlkP superfamily enzyme